MVALASIATLLPSAASAAPVRSATGAQVSIITTGLEIPWDIAFLPDGRALVTERPGRVRIVGPDGRLAAAPAASVAVSTSAEGGLLGIAVDPAFSPATPFVYLYGTFSGGIRIQRYRFVADHLSLDGVVVSGIRSASVHTSGRVRFGPDGALYIGTGDASDGELAQDPSSLNGKILRIPPGAYRGAPVRPEILASGLRHPQGLAWQPGTGRLYATDHGASGFDGPSGDDELDLIVPGGNYGWPRVRGAAQSPYLGPAHLWPQTIAPAGVAFVSQPGSSWTGSALVTGLLGKQLRRLTFDDARVVGDEPLLVGQYGRLRAVVEAPDGAMWVTTSNRDGRGSPTSGDDRILRIVPPAGGPVAPTPPVQPGPRPRPRPACVPARGGHSGTLATGLMAHKLLKNQRVAQLALRRIRALEARAAGHPAPRGRCARTSREVRFSARQLLITQRITQTVLHRHAVLSARLAGRTAPKPPTRRLTIRQIVAGPRQLAINERIAVVALKRVRALEKRVTRGALG